MKMVIATIAIVFVLGMALPSQVDAGKYRAKGLHQCVATVEQWEAAPLGAELPFAGVRFYTEDGQRGKSITYCITAIKARFEDEIVFQDGDYLKIQDADPEGSTHPTREWPASYPRFPSRLFKDVESMRLAAAPGCFLAVRLRGLQTKHAFSR